MGKKGKGRTRREANFKASHDVKELAPPPAATDLFAVPAKLRRIMQFNETKNPVNVKNGADSGQNKKQAKDNRESKLENKNTKAKKEEAPGTPAALKDNKDGQGAENASKPSSKRKREHEELLQLAEKIKAKPAKAKISDRKKRFLEEKKKKKLSNATVQALMNAPKKDHVAFGEVVQAPPQLAFPEKNKAIKEAHSAEIEKMRLQAIEAYRQRKGAKTGLGKGPPALVPIADDAT